ncbi:28427_t:CDS:2 [Dentiscutata erythropus]|uniref:28427_t:CDS:1 n=1 Tax=Dentiscutata erythropus TaxID=1348616 RepID=A0A9N9DQL7_9GLOM|nr:28427_t:CDS:2 [Dentiscutata erythropus]
MWLGSKKKRREYKYYEDQINDSLRAAQNNSNIFINIPDNSSPVASTSASALVAPTNTSLVISTSSISNKKVFTKNTSKRQITNYITSDHMSKIEQKLLELEFARSVFQCGLVLSLPEIESIKKIVETSMACI